MNNNDIAGFAAIDLQSALAANLPIAQERIEALALFLASANAPKQGTAWIVLDFMDLDLAVVNAIKMAVDRDTGLNMDRVHVLSTHNHGAGQPAKVNAIADLAAQAAKNAMYKARPAEIRGIQFAMPEGMNYRRRIEVPEFNGIWTTFAGPDMKERRSASGFIEQAIRNINDGKLSYFGYCQSQRPAPLYAPGDSDFFFMEFRDAETKEALGSLSRFAMHAIMRSNSSKYYSSDYPWHVRNEAKSRFGGTAIFMNGPCGDIAPCFPWPDKENGLARQYAEAMLNAAMQKIDALPFEPLQVRHWRRLVPLPVRTEVLENKVPDLGEMPPAEQLPQRKRHLERKMLADTLPFLQEKYRNGEILPGESSVVELGLLQLGRWTLLCYPGETFSTTAKQVAAYFPGKNMVSVTEHGRTLMYMPPEDEYNKGGYEPQCAVTSPAAENLLRQAAIQLVKENERVATMPSIITKDMLKEDLRQMGVTQEDTLLIHSSFKSIGNVEGGPDAVLDMLMDYFKENGLLVFPTLSYSEVNDEHPRFYVNETRSVLGILSDTFRKRPGVIRSLHPTHSVAAYGKDAASFTSGHENSTTPGGIGSPWWKLQERNAKILFIGNGIEHDTFCHAVDEWLELPGLRSEIPQQLEIQDYNGKVIPYSLHRHCKGRNSLYGTMETLFTQNGVLKIVNFGKALSYLLDCHAAYELLKKANALNPAALM
ncbi:MAG: AAC(3) family N-acetyltransferase [Victivallales bacterium]|nr:AAC(3) family N-acetyltransferase [Victivallales bacterium]